MACIRTAISETCLFYNCMDKPLNCHPKANKAISGIKLIIGTLL